MLYPVTKRFFSTYTLSVYYSVTKEIQNLSPNQWPKSGPVAVNVVIRVAQKWPFGSHGVKQKLHVEETCINKDKQSNEHAKTTYTLF